MRQIILTLTLATLASPSKPAPTLCHSSLKSRKLTIWQNSKVNDSMFLVNDVVRHMMGGPEMCIERRTDDGKLWCVWVSGKLNHYGLFEERDLIRATRATGDAQSVRELRTFAEIMMPAHRLA